MPAASPYIVGVIDFNGNHRNGIVDGSVPETTGSIARQKRGRGVPEARPSRPPIFLFKINEVMGRKPKIVAMHGGLETGFFYKANPKLDLVSVGPNTHAIHSADESVEYAAHEAGVLHITCSTPLIFYWLSSPGSASPALPSGHRRWWPGRRSW